MQEKITLLEEKLREARTLTEAMAQECQTTRQVYQCEAILNAITRIFINISQFKDSKPI